MNYLFMGSPVKLPNPCMKPGMISLLVLKANVCLCIGELLCDGSWFRSMVSWLWEPFCPKCQSKECAPSPFFEGNLESSS